MMNRLNDVFSFLKNLTIRKLLNFLYLQTSYFFSVMRRKNLHAGQPLALSIEPTNLCNLRCPECPSGLQVLSRKRGIIPWSRYTSIIDQVKDKAIILNLYFQGEPFLHPDLLRMVNYSVSRKLYTIVSTNGQLFDAFPFESIINSGIDRLIISADGMSQESYETYRQGGDLEKIIQGIRKLSETRHTLGSNKPYIILQFLVMQHNEHELPGLRAWAKSLGADTLQLKSPQIFNKDKKSDILPKSEKFNRYLSDTNSKYVLKSDLPNRCWRMWHSMVITWEGLMVPCCYDKDAQLNMGNVNEFSISDIWKSKTYTDFRQKILLHRNKINICCNCTEGLDINSIRSIALS